MHISDIWREFHVTSDVRKKQILLCCIWFFLVLFSYYLLKPLRDAIGTPLSKSLGDIYMVTFVSTIMVLSAYSQLVAWFSRKQVVQLVYHLTAAILVAFYFVFERYGGTSQLPMWLAATFFVWLSVFNLLVVTLFWSVMADMYTSDESKLWFGSMAAAGSLGSLTGSIAARYVAEHFAPSNLLLLSTVTFELVVVIAWRILRNEIQQSESLPGAAQRLNRENGQPSSESGVGGAFWAGAARILQSRYLLAICLFVLLGKFGATFIYNSLQNTMKVEMPDAQDRTILFAHMNIWIQSCTLLLQAVGVSLLMRLLGVGTTLAILCGALLGIFVWLSIQDSLNALIISQVLQSIVGYALAPVQHVLFTVVSREDKYKTKAFIDVIVFRASDVAAGKTCQWMLRTGASIAALSLWLLPAVGIWVLLAIYLGFAYRRRVRETHCEQSPQLSV